MKRGFCMSENIVLKSRKYRNLTQQELADRMGTDRARLSKIESGNANPTVALLEKIADALDMTLKIDFVPKEKTESKEVNWMPKEYLEIGLPEFLLEGIRDLIEARKNNLELRLDAIYADVQSSINIAFHGNMIDKEQADYLREKYL